MKSISAPIVFAMLMLFTSCGPSIEQGVGVCESRLSNSKYACFYTGVYYRGSLVWKEIMPLNKVTDSSKALHLRWALDYKKKIIQANK